MWECCLPVWLTSVFINHAGYGRCEGKSRKNDLHSADVDFDVGVDDEQRAESLFEHFQTAIQQPLMIGKTTRVSMCVCLYFIVYLMLKLSSVEFIRAPLHCQTYNKWCNATNRMLRVVWWVVPGRGVNISVCRMNKPRFRWRLWFTVFLLLSWGWILRMFELHRLHIVKCGDLESCTISLISETVEWI